MRSREEKVQVFDRVLTALLQRVQPDLIVIGCNTLSVLYPDTKFSRAAPVPVLEIVAPGVELFQRAMGRHPDAVLLLFGTETTIGEGTHRAALLRAGIPAARIGMRACPELAAYIEKDWEGDDTKLMMASFVGEAVAASRATSAPILAGLVCSHYGYAADGWREAFAEGGYRLVEVLDPNRELVERICAKVPAIGAGHARTTAEVLTMVEIAAQKKQSLGKWLRQGSPVVAAALERAVVTPDLFTWRAPVAVP